MSENIWLVLLIFTIKLIDKKIIANKLERRPSIPSTKLTELTIHTNKVVNNNNNDKL